jgi:hypothetical protein
MAENLRCVAYGNSRCRAAAGRVLAGLVLLGVLIAVPQVMPAQEPGAGSAPKVAKTPPVNPPAGSPGQPAPPPVPSGPGIPPPPVVAPEQPPATGVPSLTLNLAPQQSIRRFQFTIAANTPLKDLLPTPPKVQKTAGPVLADDLALVPEVQFQAPLKKGGNPDALERTARMIAQINHVNAVKTDGFLKALVSERTDLAGMPFAMGDACRIKGERSQQLTQAVALVRQALQGIAVPAVAVSGTTALSAPTTTAVAAPPPAPNPPPAPIVEGPTATVAFQPPAGIHSQGEQFWTQYTDICAHVDRSQPVMSGVQREHIMLARIAALMQVLAPEPLDTRMGLVRYLAGVSHVEATRALARLAIFSTEDEARQAALEALKVRRERDYTEVLLQGLHYPWPAVARRASDAIVKLERTDLVPQLVAMLDEADPRLPVFKEVEHKKVPVVRELVRVNHHRNCLLCHAPGNTGSVSPETLTAAVPVPDQPLPVPSQGYQATTPDVLVRIDVTYLRQDFSALQAVEDANPWPEMQRFDFLVRTRELSEEEAEAWRHKLTQREPGRLSPYQKAAVTALRELTGKDTAPTGEAWRRLLELPSARQAPATP